LDFGSVAIMPFLKLAAPKPMRRYPVTTRIERLPTKSLEDYPHKDTTDTIVQLFKADASALIRLCCRFNQNPHPGNVVESL
jgi:hypothetical protein